MIYANTPISEFMTEVILTAEPAEAVASAGEKMKGAGIHHLPVLDGSELVGIVSALDLLRVPPEERAKRPVSAVMTRGVTTVLPTQTVREVLTLFSKVTFNALPVVEGDQLVGIVTSADLEELLYRDW